MYGVPERTGFYGSGTSYDRLAFFHERRGEAVRLVEVIDRLIAEEATFRETGVSELRDTDDAVEHLIERPRRTIRLPILEPKVVTNPPAVETGPDPDGQDWMYEDAESDHRDGGPMAA